MGNQEADGSEAEGERGAFKEEAMRLEGDKPRSRASLGEGFSSTGGGRGPQRRIVPRTDGAAILRTECGLGGGGRRPGRSKVIAAAQTRVTAGEAVRRPSVRG